MTTDAKPVVDGLGLRKAYGDRSVLVDASITVHDGERVGLVGGNGTGKSTLGRVLAGLEGADGGAVARRRGARIEYLAQEPSLPSEGSVRAAVLASLGAWSEARSRHERATEALAAGSGDMAALVAAQAAAGEELERLGGWDRMHEAETILGHLGIEDPTRSVLELSGGERRRVALARVLIAAPDLAILDEPTNHLDVATIEWLEDHLVRRFSGALLLVTHDRYVLDRVATRTVELHRGQLASYAGGYGAYLEARAEREAHEERVERNRRNYLRRELEWLRRQPRARTTKQKARVERVEQVRDTVPAARARAAQFDAAATRLGKTILTLEGVAIERGGRDLVTDLDLRIGAGERIGILGPNGAGKTSLLLYLLDRLPAARGSKTLGENTRLAYLDQMRAELDGDRSVREAVADDQSEVWLGDRRLEVGNYLERFLFDRSAQRSKVSTLSGGERARVCLARLLCRPANVLLLDEPTNDLDVATLGALEEMLVEYPGCALVVSHDRWFLDRVATGLLVFEGDGRVDRHAGGYSDYRERVVRRVAAERNDPGLSGPPRAAEPGPPAPRPAVRTKLSFAEARELESILGRIETAEGEVARLQSELAAPETYRDRGDQVPRLQADLARAEEAVAELVARWEALEEKKAAFEAAR